MVNFKETYHFSRFQRESGPPVPPTGSALGVCTKKIKSYLSTKTYVVGTQKNRLSEMVLLSTQTYVQTDGLENISQFYAQKFCLSKPMT